MAHFLCIYWCFTLSALLGPAGSGGLGGINTLTLQEIETYLSIFSFLHVPQSFSQKPTEH